MAGKAIIHAKLAQIHIACKSLALTEDCYRLMLMRITGQESARGLGLSQLNRVLDEFRRLGWRPSKSVLKPSAKPYIRVIFARWAKMGREGLVDGSRAALANFVKRMTKTPERPEGVSDPNWLDQAEAGKIIEALKAWRRREIAKAL